MAACLPILNPNDGLVYCPDGREPDCEDCDVDGAE